MQPILFDLSVLRLYAFGFFAFLGFVVASFYVWKQSREMGWEEEKTMDKLVLSILSGLLFSRVVYVLTYQEKFTGWSEVINLVGKPGLSWWGVWLGAGLALWWMTRREVRQRGKYYDVFSIAGAWMGVFLSVGCLFNGCLVGRALPAGLEAVWPSFLALVYPVEWYLVLTSVLILAVLYRVYARFKKYRWYESKKDGFVVGVFVLLSVIQKGVLEMFVSDRLYWWKFNVNWTVGVLVGVGALVGLVYLAGRLPSRQSIRDRLNRKN